MHECPDLTRTYAGHAQSHHPLQQVWHLLQVVSHLPQHPPVQLPWHSTMAIAHLAGVCVCNQLQGQTPWANASGTDILVWTALVALERGPEALSCSVLVD